MASADRTEVHSPLRFSRITSETRNRIIDGTVELTPTELSRGNMKRFALVFALVLVVAACGDDDAESTATTQAAAATTATTEADMTDETMTDDMDDDMTDETMADDMDDDMTDDMTDGDMMGEGVIFEITTVSFASPMVVITNVGTESGNLGGHWICQRPSYQEIPDVELAPGESVAISLGGDGFAPPAGALTIEGALDLGAIAAGSGEIGLYSSNSFGSADAIVSYVEWGNSGHGRSATAVEAGAWDDGGFVATTDDTAGIQQDTIFSMAASGWSSF
jgi:hypothetical protein